MPSAYTRHMRQSATYWAPTGNDGFGNKTYAAPIVIRCRWQNDAVEFRDATGELTQSSAVVYADRKLAIRGMLAEGDLSDQFDSDGQLLLADVEGVVPYEIRQLGSSPDLRNANVLNKVYL